MTRARRSVSKVADTHGWQVVLVIGRRIQFPHVDLSIGCLSVLTTWQLAFPRVSNGRKWKRGEREREKETDGSHLFEDLYLEVT